MSFDCIIRTKRLCIRQWRPSDAKPYFQLCSDPLVMEYFPSILTKEEVDKSINRFSKHIEEVGFGFMAVEVLDTKEFIGFIGVQRLSMEAHFTPCLEIGWRLKKESWGKGFAPEGAKACIQYIFDNGYSDEIYSFTTVTNEKSERVMQKIGMHHVGFFDHPKLDESSPLLEHTLYKISRDEVA